MTKNLTLIEAAEKLFAEGGQIGLPGWWCEYADGIGPLQFQTTGNFVRLDYEEITARCWQHRTLEEVGREEQER